MSSDPLVEDTICVAPLMELIIRGSAVGDIIAVLSTDLGSRSDIPAWVAEANQEMMAIEDEDGYARFVVRKTR